MLLVSVETVKAPETNCTTKHKRRLRNKREAGANTALLLPELVNIPEKATAWPCGGQILPLLSLTMASSHGLYLPVTHSQCWLLETPSLRKEKEKHNG